MTYKFKVESRNSFGFSVLSNEISILCATVPSIPATPLTENILEKVLFDWTAPTGNGLSISSYSVLIRKSDNSYAEQIDYCNGALASVVSATQCIIPLSTLIAEPFNLVLGDSIDFKITATNQYGTSGYSTIGGGAFI